MTQSLASLIQPLGQALKRWFGFGPRERRREQRIDLGRKARIKIGGDWAVCRISNISANGALVDAVPGLAPGDQVELDLPGVDPIAARVERVTEESRALSFQVDKETMDKLRLYMSGTRIAA